MTIDSVPIWVVLLATLGLVFLSLQIGVHFRRRRQLRGGGETEMSGTPLSIVPIRDYGE